MPLGRLMPLGRRWLRYANAAKVVGCEDHRSGRDLGGSGVGRITLIALTSREEKTGHLAKAKGKDKKKIFKNKIFFLFLVQTR